MITIRIKRRESAAAPIYEEVFYYNGDETVTVADFLTNINKEISLRKGETGKTTTPIDWECGCLEGKCGACAMVINGVPRLACRAFLKDTAKKGHICLEPLSKFPLIRDLKVDRQIIFETLRKHKLWTENAVVSDDTETRHLIYQAGQCLECGCCLEVCPNYKGPSLQAGRKNAFPGPLFVAETYRADRTGGDTFHRSELKVLYKDLFYNTCDNSLACRDVCPAGLPLDEMQARLNSKKRT